MNLCCGSHERGGAGTRDMLVRREGRERRSWPPMGGVGHLVLSGPLVLAVPVAAAAGAVSFLSPCCLPLVPGYVSYVTGMSGADLQQRAPRTGPGTLAASADLQNLAGQSVPSGRQRETAGRGRTLAGAALFVLGFA